MEENRYTFKQLLEKYNLHCTSRMLINKAIHFLELRGIKVQLIEVKKTAYYKILDDSIFNLQFLAYPFDDRYEVAKEGYARSIETKRLVGRLDDRGYVTINGQHQKLSIHRMVMETYKPIENMTNFVVDHIDGIRDHNDINNLRWLTIRQNNEEKDKNFAMLNQNYQKLIQKHGYEGLNKIFTSLLD